MPGDQLCRTPAILNARQGRALWLRLRDDRGSGSVLALAIAAAAVALAITLVIGLSVHAARTRVAVAADAAALAAADTASGRVPGEACARASAVADVHGVTLVDCASTRTESTVRVTLAIGPLTLAASARAGLPR